MLFSSCGFLPLSLSPLSPGPDGFRALRTATTKQLDGEEEEEQNRAEVCKHI